MFLELIVVIFILIAFVFGISLGYVLWGGYKIYKDRYDFLIEDWNRLHKGDKKNV